MTPKNQVCTLEQAKKLNELGIIQGLSLFYYDCGGGIETIEFNRSNDLDGEYYNALSCYSAFTASELLFMNHETITINTLQLSNLADAIADHLLGRIERGDITVEEINSRLK